MNDLRHMARALALAERGRGRTSPNPMVGAVVVDDDGVVVGQGAHEVAGGPHAEVHALAEAGERARGATLYCTLEPCAHTGRTGPCAPLVAGAGIRRAVVAIQDPNPLVAGRGLAYLRDRGVQVDVGVLRELAARQNAAFLSVMRRGRPFVTMKVALSRDRRVAAGAGLRTRLTGEAANRFIHRERAEVDAIGVGAGTVAADDPLLTARGAYRSRPLVRVIFDRALRTPPTARVLATVESGPILLVSAPRDEPDWRGRVEALTAAGARVLSVPGDTNEASIRAALPALAAEGVTSLVLEGGPTLHRAAWTAGAVDRVQVFMTPVVLGGDGVAWLDDAEIALDDLHDRRTLALGNDVMTEGYVYGAD